MITSTTKRTGFITLIMLAGSVSAAGALYWYSFDLESSLRDKKAEIAAFEAQKSTVAKAKAMTALALEDAEALERVSLTQDDAIGFLSDLEGSVRQTGVTFTTDALTVNSEEKIPTISFRFTMMGPETLVQEQVEKLETFPSASWFESYEWRRAEGGVEVEIILHVALDT